ncbi:MAG: putative lipid II flippase FtsW [Ndongobacter sp.]|nr:putative lipid II flippase FtsW [Ndongobacter sp.]
MEKSRSTRRIKPSVKRRNGAADRPLLYVTLSLILIGLIMIYSASSPYAASVYGDAAFFFKRTLIYAAVSLFMLWLVSWVDYRRYRRWHVLLYIAAYILCLLVFVPGLGRDINDARRWIFIGTSISIMPSDFMKIGAILFLAARMCKATAREKNSVSSGLLLLLFIGLTIFPIAKQPNFSAVVIISVSLVVLYFVGGGGKKGLLLISVLLIGGGVLAFFPYPGNYRLERLLSTWDPWKDPLSSSWQLIQSLYAVSSGGWFGTGLGAGSQKFGYLAEEPHNDFIFSVICEEWGFAGALLILAAFLFFSYRGFQIARRARDDFGRYIGYGLTFVVISQALVNIGVAIGLIPTTGVTLPFVSYGGSSLLAMCVITGILLNISRDQS